MAEYAEEQSGDGVWKLVKFAKNSWQTKETMKDLRDDSGRGCGTDEDKLQALVGRNIFTKDQEPLRVGGSKAGEKEVEVDVGNSVEKFRKGTRSTRTT